MNITFRLFDLTENLPFSQGYAIKAIMDQHGGRLIEAGEMHSGLDVVGTYLYVKMESLNTAQTIWHDDGCGLLCVYRSIDNESWKQRVGESTDWIESDIVLATITWEQAVA